MTLVEKQGDLFTSTAEALGHGVNCTGIMGAGIAKEFRRRWPDMYDSYRSACELHLLQPGEIFPYSDLDGRLIINLASQNLPGPHATYAWLRSALEAALQLCSDRGIKSLAIPRIGCGIGGLNWEAVRRTMVLCSDLYPDMTLEVWSL